MRVVKLADLDRYDFKLPPERIRTAPLKQRDQSRLFVYDTASDTISYDLFANIGRYLPHESVVVLNNTRVRPARLALAKDTGGKIEALILVNDLVPGNPLPALLDRRAHIGQKLFLPNGDFFIVRDQREAVFLLELESRASLDTLLERFGTVPLPPYLAGKERPPETQLRERYQTVFAKTGDSVAAPTAGLHFTEDVLADLRERGMDMYEITLNVGRGTFAPLTEENFTTRKLHPEWISVSPKAADGLTQAINAGHPIVAVGTTVTRTLETVMSQGRIESCSGIIETFIFPPYRFRAIDALVTNFHLPRSSLLLLVDAFLESKRSPRRVLDLYRQAMTDHFAFYSFGDSMLLL